MGLRVKSLSKVEQQELYDELDKKIDLCLDSLYNSILKEVSNDELFDEEVQNEILEYVHHWYKVRARQLNDFLPDNRVKPIG